MFASTTHPRTLPSRRWSSAGAIAAAFFANLVLTLLTDQLLHVLEVFPPWGQAMNDAGDNLLALAYRTAYGVLAGYLAARLAPRAPMLHVRVLGIIAVILSTVGAVVTLSRFELGPAWYPVMLAVLAFPSIWLGGLLHARGQDR